MANTLSFIYKAFCFILTKILYPNAKIIRFPIYLRGKIIIGKNMTTGVNCRIENYSNKYCSLKIGENCQINDNVHIACYKNINIGNNVLIASRVFITDHNHGNYVGVLQSKPNEIPEKRIISSLPVIIEDNVWIGEGVAILPGVKIGYGSIIGANAVVTKNVEPNTINIGIPARAIKKYNFSTKKWENI